MRGRVAAVACAALALLGLERPPGLAEVVAVRHWSHPGYTRVVVELERAVETDLQRLPADPQHARPERLYLDLPGVWVGRAFDRGIEVDDGLLRGVRLGQNTLHKTRVVIDLDRYDRHRLLVLSHPDRIVIDVYGDRKAPPPVSAGGRTADAALPAPLREVQRVVVDAGHGGRDPGAIGVGGLREKDVTLRIAQALSDELSQRGFEVFRTRSDDRTLTLEERTAMAESVGGDLFLSIHANASPRRSVHGVETYYLDENHTRHALNLAARENGIPRHQVNVLQRTLAKLHMEEISPHSRLLAEHVQQQMVLGMPAKSRPLDLGVKRGPFYVLFLSNMPAVLVETGFLTHRSEARRLRDAGYLARIAEQIAVAVERYRGARGTRMARREGE